MPNLPEPEVWSDETKAYFLLINSMSKEEYDSYLQEIRGWGVDIASIEGLPPNYRDELPSQAEWTARVQSPLEKAVA